MVQNHFSLTWDSYKSSICSGFSSLQQNGEFVDMTLAADGHLVKVHQVLIALASPYLKELINSIPNQHPVIFLNNVPHTTLGLLLEYIYSGEVLVPARHLQSFMETAKTLHIRGLDSVSSSYYSNVKVAQSNESATLTPPSRGLPVDVHSVQTSFNLPADAMKVSIRAEPQACNIILPVKAENQRPKNEYQSYGDHVMDASADNDSDDDRHMDNLQIATDPGAEMINQRKGETDNENSLLEMPDAAQMDIQEKVSSNNLQFTVSIRGSLQVILNRYMYNLQSTSQETGVRRWRCIDYRNKKCPATLITKGNVVTKRACLHSHLFHDKKILAKIEKNAVYSALDDVEGYKEKEKRRSDDEEWPVDSSGFMALEAEMSDSTPSKTRRH